MVEVEPVIVGVLAQTASLSGYAVRGATDADESRRPVPAIDVSYAGMRVVQTTASAVTVAAGWSVRVILARGSAAARQLGEIAGEVITALHGFKPGKVDGTRYWGTLNLVEAHMPESVEQGLVQCELIFQTIAEYSGRKW